MPPLILTERDAALLAWQRTAGCKRGGRHWHVYVPTPLLPQGARAFVEHDWSASLGHSGVPDPTRRHRHMWDAAVVAAVVAEFRRAGLNRMASSAARLVGTPRLDWSIDRQPDIAAWMRDEELVARSLVPDLRPSRLRDA